MLARGQRIFQSHPATNLRRLKLIHSKHDPLRIYPNLLIRERRVADAWGRRRTQPLPARAPLLYRDGINRLPTLHSWAQPLFCRYMKWVVVESHCIAFRRCQFTTQRSRLNSLPCGRDVRFAANSSPDCIHARPGSYMIGRAWWIKAGHTNKTVRLESLHWVVDQQAASLATFYIVKAHL
jgi:hypothetical protein